MEKRVHLLAASMMKQEDLAFLKPSSAIRQSPALLQELRKALAASKEKSTVAPCKAGTFPGVPTRRQHVAKRKASHLGLETSGGSATLGAAPKLASGSGPIVFPLRVDMLPRAASSYRGQFTPRLWPRALLYRKVGRLSPQPRIRSAPNPLPPLR